ncbi:hypothetical protein KIW84_011735 [Lathyrus oleraceus]|uniref:Uncharacterized protein n=1 Tax=Pisum sativum TaxID=3888 RepID=A0A9D5GVJ5_PEA|nr:hypothetical protein KIW84_011735 [Pisum sativum]
MLTSETSVKEILNDKSVDPVKNIDSICTSSPGNRMSNVFSKAFQELCGHLIDVVDEEEFGDIPPGFEKNSQIIFPPYNSKFRPSRTVECNPKITEYVAVALCRQKLHDEVLEKWKLSILDATFKQVLTSSSVNTQQIHSSTSGNAMILSSDVHVLPEAPVPDTEIKPNDLPSHNGFEHVHAVIPAPLLAEVVDRMPILYQYYTHSISSEEVQGTCYLFQSKHQNGIDNRAAQESTSNSITL